METLLHVKFIKGDLRSVDLLNHVFKSEKIDVVMHFAAQSHVDNSFGNSFEFTKNNIEGTHALLESVRLAGSVERFIHISTDEVYGESSFETDSSNTEHSSLLAPTNPYSASKAGAEMLVMAYGRSYGLPYIITRGNNVYGPNQYPEKAVPKFTLLALRGKHISIHGDGLATRSYMHVCDAASAFDFILRKGELSHVYNIGACEERTVLSVAQDVCRLLKRNPEDTITHVTDRAFNDRRYFIDSSKLQALGWRQQVTWEQGLRETVDWYKTEDLSSYWHDFEAALTPHPATFCRSDLFSPGAGLTAQVSRANATLAGKGPNISNATFLVYGKTGWIGGLLGQILAKTNHSFFYGSARLYDRHAIEEDIQRCKPSHILNAAGITGRPNVDWCESHKREVVQTNVLGTLNLIDVAKSHRIHVTNFATGCIYSYDNDHPLGSGQGFTEDDEPNFRDSYYSKTKAMVEELLKEYDNVLQLRLRMPIDDDLQNPRNFIYKIMHYKRVVNIPNSMSVLNELLPLAVEGALRQMKGVYNFTNPGTISHNDVLQLYKKYCDVNFTWENFSLEEQAKILVAPRSNNELDTTKLERAFPGILDIRSSLITHVFEANRSRNMNS